jgi:hypothetical protein
VEAALQFISSLSSAPVCGVCHTLIDFTMPSTGLPSQLLVLVRHLF